MNNSFACCLIEYAAEMLFAGLILFLEIGGVILIHPFRSNLPRQRLPKVLLINTVVVSKGGPQVIIYRDVGISEAEVDGQL